MIWYIGHLRYGDFNSIKVRLEHGSGSWVMISARFQFHKGAIRTRDPDCVRAKPHQFQFHKGAIRTLLLRNGRRLHLDFNSIKVRLELQGRKLQFAHLQFQFHKGAIRTKADEGATYPGNISIP